MIIDQVEALKTWLTSKLSPICDAEPVALAKYVCALVKKDKPEQDLRDVCMDQLDVFLQQNTKPFVNDLFEALKSKAYITPASENPKAAPAPPKNASGKEKEDGQRKKGSEISSTTDDKENKSDTQSTATKGASQALSDPAKDNKDTSAPPSGNREPVKEAREPRGTSRDAKDRRDTWRDERSRDGVRDARDIIREKEKDAKGGEVKDGRGDTREVREPRERDYRRRRSRSRSYSPRRRDFDRRRFDDRLRYSPDRRWGRRRSWSRSPRRNRSPLRRGSRSPRRSSRSPRVGGRASHSPARHRPMRSRSRSPRRRSWSRPGSGGGAGRQRSRSWSNSRQQPDSRGSTPLQDNEYISSSTTDQHAVSSTVGSKIGVVPSALRARCQNFEEKGFCMLGDNCPYDHGADPVVVDDDAIALGPGDPYVPEAPGLHGPMRPPFIRGPPPDLNRPPPGMGPGMNRPPGPPDMYPMGRREVIMGRPHPGMSDRAILESGGPQRSEPSRIVISKRPYPGDDLNPMQLGPPPIRMARMNHMYDPSLGPPPPMQQQMMPQQMGPMQAGQVRKEFDYNRLGNRGFKHQGPNTRTFNKFGNMTLEVRKIPALNNNIAKLNEHFGKFGTLTNIQVKFQGDPGAALISFSTNAEAAAAYRSPEPVFNNRFIKLFWHNAEKPLGLDGERDTPVEGPDGDQGAPGGQHQQMGAVLKGGRVGDGIDHPSLVLPVRPTIPPAHKMTLDNTKNKQKDVTQEGDAATVASTAQPDAKSIVYTSSMGNLKKTVFNPAAANTPVVPAAVPPKPKPAAPFVSPTAVKTADYVSRMEAIKRIEEERKLAPAKQLEIDQKKQELLARQIEQQKKLLETLEKKKDSLSDAEKQSLKTNLRKISDAIDTVKYSTGAKKATAPVAPQQFRYVSNQEQAAASYPAAPYGRGRGGWSHRGRGRGWAAGSAFGGRTSLDNRPKTVEVKGFDLSEIDEIRAHFQRYGEIEKEDLVEEIPSAFFTFSMRQSAEMAVAQGLKFKKKSLVVRWNQMTPKISRTESTQSSELDDNVSIGGDSAILASISDISSIPSTPVELKDGPELPATDQGLASRDTRTFEEASPATHGTETANKPASVERSLSEDLLAGEEEHFKASYSDDDDEDHITVTLSNTSTSAPTIYTSSGHYSQAGRLDIKQEENNEEDDLSSLAPGPDALDLLGDELLE